MLRILIGLLSLILSATVTQAQSGYQVTPGDTLRIEVLEDPGLNRNVLVLPDGSFNFPFVGAVRAGGRSVAAIRGDLTSNLSSQFQSPPNVYVAVAARALPTFSGAVTNPDTDEIYVMGEVNAPGLIDARPGTTLLQALAQAGGLTRFAAAKRIQLRRNNQVMNYDFHRTGKKPSIAGNTVLNPGDVIVVPQRRLFE